MMPSCLNKLRGRAKKCITTAPQVETLFDQTRPVSALRLMEFRHAPPPPAGAHFTFRHAPKLLRTLLGNLVPLLLDLLAVLV